jgi:hypothetical protein
VLGLARDRERLHVNSCSRNINRNRLDREDPAKVPNASACARLDCKMQAAIRAADMSARFPINKSENDKAGQMGMATVRKKLQGSSKGSSGAVKEEDKLRVSADARAAIRGEGPERGRGGGLR